MVPHSFSLCQSIFFCLAPCGKDTPFVVTIKFLNSVRCANLDQNGSPTKRTVLHDLYEKEGQSPWYDNLCRPVTDLLPLIASGVRGVTSNPAVITQISFCFLFVVMIDKRKG